MTLAEIYARAVHLMHKMFLRIPATKQQFRCDVLFFFPRELLTSQLLLFLDTRSNHQHEHLTLPPSRPAKPAVLSRRRKPPPSPSVSLPPSKPLTPSPPNKQPPSEPTQSPALSVTISTSFPSSEIFGIKLINNHPTLAVLSIANDEPAPITVVFVGGSLWTLPDTPSSPPVPQIVRNLTTTRYNGVEVPAGEKQSVEYRFSTELQPQELVLNLAAVVRGEDGVVVTVPAFNETVAVVEAEVGFFDPQMYVLTYTFLPSLLSHRLPSHASIPIPIPFPTILLYSGPTPLSPIK